MADDHGKKDDKHHDNHGGHGNEKKEEKKDGGKKGGDLMHPGLKKAIVSGVVLVAVFLGAIWIGIPLVTLSICSLVGAQSCPIVDRMWGPTVTGQVPSGAYAGGYGVRSTRALPAPGTVLNGMLVHRPDLRPAGSHRCVVGGMPGNCW